MKSKDGRAAKMGDFVPLIFTLTLILSLLLAMPANNIVQIVIRLIGLVMLFMATKSWRGLWICSREQNQILINMSWAFIGISILISPIDKLTNGQSLTAFDLLILIVFVLLTAGHIYKVADKIITKRNSG